MLMSAACTLATGLLLVKKKIGKERRQRGKGGKVRETER